MEMRHLRAFRMVAETLHFGRAAQRLRVAQPAVSTAIAELEQEIGVVLFTRTRRSVALSPAGAQFLLAAGDALATLEGGAVAARRAANGETGRVVVHFAAMAAFSVLPGALAKFRAQRPDVQLLLRQQGTVEQLGEVRAGRCDVAFTIMPGNVKPLASAVVGRQRLVAVLPANHRRARARALTFAAIASEPMLILPRATEPAIVAAYQRLCAGAGVTPNVAMELDQIEATLAFVAAGLGVTLMPASVARLGFPGIKTVALKPSIPSEATLVWDADRASPAALALVAEIRAQAKLDDWS